MSIWKYKLDFKDFYHADNLTIQEKAEMVVKKIEKTFPALLNINLSKYDSEIDEIKEHFDEVACHADSDANDFDNVMEELYDWCDQEIAPFGQWPRNKMCWINTK